MPVYVALLRGINLGPHKRMKMEHLRESLAAVGLQQVQTYIQSGNIVFKAAKMLPTTLSKRIEDRIVSDFGFSSMVITRMREELSAMLEANPFRKNHSADPARLHVTFLAEKPTAAALQELKGLTKAPDESFCLGREIYFYLPNGMAKSSLMNNPLERRLLKAATTRNWKTVIELHKMCQACR